MKYKESRVYRQSLYQMGRCKASSFCISVIPYFRITDLIDELKKKIFYLIKLEQSHAPLSLKYKDCEQII